MNNGLVFSPVLNFLQFNRDNGVNENEILKFGKEFFLDLPSVIEAKKLLYDAAVPGTELPRRQGPKALESHLKDMLSIFEKCDDEDIDLPMFVIRSPNDVPVIPALVYSSLNAKLNRMEHFLKTVSSKFDSYDNHFPPLPARATPSTDSHTTVVVSKVPQTLNDPIKRKEVLDKVSCHDAVTKLSLRGDKWLINVKKSAAEEFKDSISVILAESPSKVITKRFFGIVRGISKDLDLSFFQGYPGVVEAMRLGDTGTVKLEFCDSMSKAKAMQNGVKLGYEYLSVKEYLSAPRCCLKCRSPDHRVADCASLVAKCARCAGPHISTKDSPCQLDARCANCGENHASFSLRCKVLRDIIAKKK